MSKSDENKLPAKGHHYTLAKQASRLLEIGFGQGDSEVGYSARMLFHTMLPHSAQEAREWMRQNGRLKVYIQAGPGLGLPYGTYPRLVFVWLVTEAYRTKDRKLILGDSLSDFMRQLGLLPSGGRWGSITRLRDQMQRLFSARLAAVIDGKGGEGRSERNMLVADDYDLWWSPKSPDQAALWQSNVVLGERFYQQIIKKPFPVDMRILKAIKRSPLGIDLYTMLTYRVYYMKKPTVLSWRQLHEQFGADYKGKYAIKDFRLAAIRELEKIKAAWPELNYETPRGRLKIHPGPASVKQIKKGGQAGG